MNQSGFLLVLPDFKEISHPNWGWNTCSPGRFVDGPECAGGAQAPPQAAAAFG